MDLAALSALELPDPRGGRHRLGDYWAERRVALVFLRHFGWLLCREHAAQLRDAYAALRSAGAEVVAVGTGNPGLARAFVEDYRIPYPVLVDADARAARAAAIRSLSLLGMFQPASWAGTRRAWRGGHRIGTAGRRVTQLGSTFVVGPGPELLYAHRDAHSADHAPLEEVLAALGAGSRPGGGR